MFQKGVRGIKLDNFMEFLMVKVKGLGTTNKSKLIIVGSFSKNFHDLKVKNKKKR